MDFGFEAAGFEVHAALELDLDCCRTLRQNRAFPVIQRDIHDVPTSEILSTASLGQGEVDLLFGGPPCQPFSKAAYWSRGDTLRLEDPRAATLSAFMRVVAESLPRAFVLENVHGISYSGKEEGFQYLFDAADAINKRHGTDYQPTWEVLNAADYGVPQIRKRFFLVACRDGHRFRFPAPTHAPAPPGAVLLNHAPEPYRTAWDALGDLPTHWSNEDLSVKGRWRALLPSIPEGENYLWHTNRKGGLPLFGWRTRYWSFLLKLAKRLPSWTIQAQPGPAIGPFHWKSRMLSMRELARIQTFPDNMEIVGPNRRSIQQQLGNAVPSLVAEVLGREIRRQVFGDSIEREPNLMPPRREPIPGPEPVGDVPEEYLHLVGDHPDHPGTGRGNAAVGRVAVD